MTAERADDMTIDRERCEDAEDKERMLYYSAVKLDNCFTALRKCKNHRFEYRHAECEKGTGDCRCKSY